VVYTRVVGGKRLSFEKVAFSKENLEKKMKNKEKKDENIAF
jgi:hypothetical protein